MKVDFSHFHSIKGRHVFEGHHSHVDRCTVMSSEQKLEEIVEDLRKELNAALCYLDWNERVPESDRSLSKRWFNLEFGVVSPLYYRLQRHLIDWGTRSHHPHLSELRLMHYLDKEGKSYKDKVLDIPGDLKS